MSHVQDTTKDNLPQPTELPLGHRVRYVIARLLCRLGPLGRQMKRVGCWLEDDVFGAGGIPGQDALMLNVHSSGSLSLVQQVTEDVPTIGDCRELCDLLGRLGIHHIRVDTRLESNQIQDLLTFLYAHGPELASRHGTGRSRSIVAQLQSQDGLHFNCMQIRLCDDLLVVKYSYCVTRLSLAVRWFERRHRRLGDHRALFHAAPRYGILAVALPLAVLMGFLLTRSVAFLAAATVVEAAILFAAVYVFMRGMGGIEYDNEENAYRLGQAHTTLTRYADRIRQDLTLARTVQQKLLPDREQMPLADCIEWATNFNPETEVGGDYFDAAALDEHRAAIVFADVSGHGMAAALITVIVKMAFQSWVDSGWSVSDFVRCVNRDLCRFTPDGSFVVLVAAVYDDEQKRLIFVNCGHAPEPFYLPARPDQPVARLTQLGSMLLGVLEDVEVRETNLPLAPGDAILLATDGLTEARNNQDELYGKDRLREYILAHQTKPLADLVESLVQDVSHFTQGTAQTDDRTVLAFRVLCEISSEDRRPS